MTHRFYGDLAPWWPLISPPAEYAEEAAFVASVLGTAAIPVREVLELGSGGGHNAAHLKGRFDLTLVDLSPDMLDVSRRLNPECEHHQGDMRTVRLDRLFDAVFVHDAIDYMITVADLRRAVRTAFEHCRPGGLALFAPDDTRESFTPYTDHGGSDGSDGLGVRYLEWTRLDPDGGGAADSDGGGAATVLTDYVFLVRRPGCALEVVHETHRTGLFGRDEWLATLATCGFEPRSVTEVTDEDRAPRELFAGHRPG
jgi:SAM-dependent methyltransferase